jgi:hypothetical protein
MALSFPKTPTNLQQYTDSNGIVWEYNSTKGIWSVKKDNQLKQFSGAKIELDAALTLTNTLSTISWDSAEFDTNTYFNSISSPTKLLITSTGYYRINVLLITGNQGNGASYTFSVKVNGTTDLTNDTTGPNTGVHYDEIHLLHSGDYVEIWGSEDAGVGTLQTNSYFEIERIGYALGSAYGTLGAFSGVKVELASVQNTTSTPTALTWDVAPFNVNADINGNLYWDISTADKINIYTNGYYRIKSFFKTGTAGTSDSYKIDVRLDGTTLESGSIGASETLDLDETYNFLSGSYVQVYVDNLGSVGTITTDSYFELIRVGV